MEKAKGYQKAVSLTAAQHCSSSLQHQPTSNLSKSKPCWIRHSPSSVTTEPRALMEDAAHAESSQRYHHPKIARAVLEYYEPPLLLNVSRVMWSIPDCEYSWQRKGWDGGAAKCPIQCWVLCTALWQVLPRTYKNLQVKSSYKTLEETQGKLHCQRNT